jgi:hypothetical protein
VVEKPRLFSNKKSLALGKRLQSKKLNKEKSE